MIKILIDFYKLVMVNIFEKKELIFVNKDVDLFNQFISFMTFNLINYHSFNSYHSFRSLKHL